MTTLREQIEAEVGQDIKQLAQRAEKAEHCLWPTMMLTVLDIIDAHRCIPDRDALARALERLLPQHREGRGGYPYQSSDRSWTVYDWMTPDELADAIIAALEKP